MRVHSPKPCAQPAAGPAPSVMSDERPLHFHASLVPPSPDKLDGGVELDDDNSADIIVCTEWDKFHRVDIALRIAVKASSLAKDVFELCTKLDSMFGGGEGQQLLRSAAEASGVLFYFILFVYLSVVVQFLFYFVCAFRLCSPAVCAFTGSNIRRGAMPGMTRKVVGLAQEPGQLLDNFKAYASALHAREFWRQEGSGTYTKESMCACQNVMHSICS